MNHSMVTNKFPAFLVGVCTPVAYRRWLFRETRSSESWHYEEAMHRAVERAVEFDEYTGLPLRWDLLDEYAATPPEGFEPSPDLPSIEREKDRNEPAFKVCARHIRAMKWNLDSTEFVAVCHALANAQNIDASRKLPSRKTSGLPASTWLPEAENCPKHLYHRENGFVLFWGAWRYKDWVCRVTGRVGEIATLEREQAPSEEAAAARVKQEESAQVAKGYNQPDFHPITITLHPDCFERDHEGVSEWQDELTNDILRALKQRALGIEEGADWGLRGVKLRYKVIDDEQFTNSFISELDKNNLVDYLREISADRNGERRVVYPRTK